MKGDVMIPAQGYDAVAMVKPGLEILHSML